MKKIFIILFLGLIFFNKVNASCDDTPSDGVDYSNCQFSEAQDLSRAYIPNSNLSLISFIKVIFDKSVMMNSTLANGNFTEASFVKTNLYESNLEGGLFEKANFSSANLTRVNFRGASLDISKVSGGFSSTISYFVVEGSPQLQNLWCAVQT